MNEGLLRTEWADTLGQTFPGRSRRHSDALQRRPIRGNFIFICDQSQRNIAAAAIAAGSCSIDDTVFVVDLFLSLET